MSKTIFLKYLLLLIIKQVQMVEKMGKILMERSQTRWKNTLIRDLKKMQEDI